MSRALQVYYAAFDDVFLKLPEAVRNRIETEIDDMGRRLTTFPHYRMTGGHRYRPGGGKRSASDNFPTIA